MRILIAEDEPGTNETYRLLLDDEGHEVTVTSNGEECLLIYRRNVEAFDLLILDYRMPVKDGGIVLREVLKTNPNQKVLVASAYSKTLLRRLNLDVDNVKVLQKPFEPELLLDTVNELSKISAKK